MHIFAIFLLLWILVIIFNKNNSYNKTIILLLSMASFLELFVNAGYFIKIAYYELKYSEFVVIILFFYILVIWLKKPIGLTLYKYLFYFILFILINNILIYIMPYKYPVVVYGGESNWETYLLYGGEYLKFSKQVIMMNIRYLLFIFVAYVSITYCNNDDYEIGIDNFIKLATMAVYYVLIELICNYLGYGEQLTEIRNYIIGEASSTAGFFVRAHSFALSGLTLEPGHLAKALWILLLIYILKQKYLKYPWIICVIFLIFMTTSFAGVLYIISIIFIFATKSKNIKKKLLILFLITIFIFVLLIIKPYLLYYNIERLNSVFTIFKLNDYTIGIGSETIRILSIVVNYKVFIQNMFFGVGIGTVYSYSALIDILSTIGIVGTSILFSFYKHIIKTINGKILLILSNILFVSVFIDGVDIFYSMYTILFFLSVKLMIINNDAENYCNIYLKQ